MSLITNFVRAIYEGPSQKSKKMMLFAGLFAIALAVSVGLGIASRGFGGAAVIRDTDSVNSIDGANRNGGIGAADANEFIQDLRDNVPGDLQTIYADPRLGALTPNLYDQFKNEAVQGEVWRDGHVTVNGQTVWNNVWTMGRTTMGGKQRSPIDIGGKTYYYSSPSVSFAASRQYLPALVWFDERGEVRMAVLNACGNNVGGGDKVRNNVQCSALNMSQPDAEHQPNVYNFTTNVSVSGNARISRVVYTFSDDGSTVVKTGEDAGSQVVEHTFKKDGTVTATVYASVPGGHEIQSTAVAECSKAVKYIPPFYACTNLRAVAIDDKKKAFRFTAIHKTDTTGQTTLENVDFTLDAKDATKGVTTKDDEGYIYKEYKFTDDVTHKVVATLNFNTAEGVQSVDCQASVTPAKTPMCTVPGKEQYPVDSPECKENPTPPQVKGVSTTLVNTGPGDVAGIVAGFVAISVLGFVGHNLFLRRRVQRNKA